ncbi:MAG TPA: SUF system NifU family Fe-S cluster assembly protein [Fimbriimonadaceae bacterium]|nr:SUF system NifU family Fe-S cluster assembly protein [Fimbriimonadaceae bacterium]
MSELRELYKEIILDHNRQPRNFGVPESATSQADGHNPLCGDQVTIYLDIRDGIVHNVRFMGSGCAISVASASIMTEAVQGKTVAEAEVLFEQFHHAMTEDRAAGPITGEDSELDALSGVKEFPIRVKCATLPWHTLRAALHGENSATTEGEK